MADAEGDRGVEAGAGRSLRTALDHTLLIIMPAIVPTSETRAVRRGLIAQALLPYVAIFIAAATTRLVVAFIFFGSVDIVNDALDSARLLDGSLLSARVPYLPGIHLLLWLGGQFAVRTSLPVAFCYKVFPCLFDSLIAVLIAVWRPDRPGSLRLGYLYAFAPVPVIVMALHGQWDSVFLYFLILSLFLLRIGTRIGDLAAGVAFVLSVIVKPVAAPLLPFLFPAPWLLFGRRRDRDARLRMGTLILAMGGATAGYLLLLSVLHARLGVAELRQIFAYAQHGVQIMGFRMFGEFGLPRAVGLVSLIALLPAYWSGRLSRERAVLLFFAFVLGLCGSAPQYLCWIVPFAMLSGDLRFNAGYNALCGIVLLVYYRSAGTDLRNLENLGAYLPLRRFAWLASSLTNLWQSSSIVTYGGNVIIPLMTTTFFALALLGLTRRDRPVIDLVSLPIAPLQKRVAGLSLIGVGLLLGACCVWASLQPRVTGDALTRKICSRIDSEYWSRRLPGANSITNAPVWVPVSFVNGPSSTDPVNAFTIGIAWTVAWAAAASAMAAGIMWRADA